MRFFDVFGALFIAAWLCLVGAFAFFVLDDGDAQIVVTATDEAGNTTTVEVAVTFETPDPEAELVGGGLSASCSTTPGSDPSLLLALIVMGLVALRRRKTQPMGR